MPTDQPDPDVTTSAPRPSIADQPPPNPTGLALVHALADQRRNPVIVVQSYDAALLRTRETDEWGVGSSFDRAWQYDREGASWGLTKAEAMRRYATLTLQGFCEACVALYDSGVDECPTCHPPAAETPEEPAVAATPPAIPGDLRALLEALAVKAGAVEAAGRAHRALAFAPNWYGTPEERGALEVARVATDRFGLAVDALIAWTRAHAGTAPAPLTDDELAAMWRLRIGTSPSPNGLTLMRAIRNHAGGGR